MSVRHIRKEKCIESCLSVRECCYSIVFQNITTTFIYNISNITSQSNFKTKKGPGYVWSTKDKSVANSLPSSPTAITSSRCLDKLLWYFVINWFTISQWGGKHVAQRAFTTRKVLVINKRVTSRSGGKNPLSAWRWIAQASARSSRSTMRTAVTTSWGFFWIMFKDRPKTNHNCLLSSSDKRSTSKKYS